MHGASVSGGSVEIAPSLFQESSGGSIPTSPHQLIIQVIDAPYACSLNEKWHSRLPVISPSNVVRNTYSICFGAHYDGKMYAVAIWSSPVAQNRMKHGKQILELRRLAICRGAPKNTATRMISIMVRMIRKKYPDIWKLISYQDTDVHTGMIYKASNWQNAGESVAQKWDGKRKRNVEQSLASKIRWEYIIGEAREETCYSKAKTPKTLPML